LHSGKVCSPIFQVFRIGWFISGSVIGCGLLTSLKMLCLLSKVLKDRGKARLRLDINDLITLWNQANCKVIDIRRITIRAGESPLSYKVPSTLFLMSVRGNATAELDRQIYRLERFTVLHAGKDSVLSLAAGSEGLDYYTVYYRAGSNHPALSELDGRPEQAHPFDHSYSITPENPVVLHQILSEMYKDWRKQKPPRPAAGPDFTLPVRI
jgi:hypothetical protein